MCTLGRYDIEEAATLSDREICPSAEQRSSLIAIRRSQNVEHHSSLSTSFQRVAKQ
jgi:hypothetical protein